MNAVNEAKALWNSLNGVICIYKPPRYSWKGVSKIIRQKIGLEINSRIPKKGIPIQSNPLLAGPLIIERSISLYSTLNDYFASGVAVLGLRSAWHLVCRHQRSSPIKVYHVKGRLGIGTSTFDTEGKLLERASYFHVSRETLDNAISTIQSVYQRTMYEACGVHRQSQTAYELAVRGLIRPTDRNLPVFYGIKCIDFQLPEFTLEVQCIHENSLYLKKLIHEVGFRLHTVAVCSGIRCIRYGPFTVEHALARHKWNVETFLEHMEESTKMLIADLVSDRLQSPNLIAPSDSSWEETEKKLIARGIITPDLVPDRLQSPNLIAPSDTSWEETAKETISRGEIIRNYVGKQNQGTPQNS